MKWISFFISIFYLSVVSSQTPNWQISTLNPSIDIVGIEHDSLGFLWISDHSSLYRFDGVDAIQKFRFDDELITELVMNSGQFVIGTSTGRIVSFNPYTNTDVVIKEVTDSLPITSLYLHDRYNYITLSYGFGMEVVTDGKSEHYDDETGLISNEVYDIIYHNHQYYLATDQGIQIFDADMKPITKSILTETDGLSDLVITNLAVYQDQVWYTDYNRNVGLIDKQNRITNYNLPITTKINSITNCNANLLIATDVGLYQLQNQSISRLFPSQGIEKVLVSETDEEGNIWLYSGEEKLYRGSMCFQKLDTKIGNIRAISVFNEQLMLGNEEGLFVREGSNVRRVSSDNITHLAASQDYIIVGTFSKGIKVYDRKLSLISDLDQWSNIKNQSVLHIYIYQEFAFISSLSGVTKFTFSDGVLTPLNSLNSIIGSAYIYTIEEKENKLYLGTDRNGLIIWEMSGDGIQEINTFENGEKIGSVYSLTFDKTGDLWFTSSKKGIGQLLENTPAALETYQAETDEYTAIKTLSDGNVIAIRSNSIDLINTKDLHIIHFDKEIGLKNGQAFLNTITFDKEQIYFVHDQSIFTYFPACFTKTRPEVIIDKVLVNLAEVGDRNVLDQNENNIEISYTGSWLKSPAKLLYQYKLQGFDEDWRVTKDRSVAFPKLSPGKYEFNLRTSENEYFDQESTVSYKFEIRKHFYNLWWVRSLGLCCLLFLSWKFIKIRESRKREKQALEKLSIENQLINLKNQLNPHFLFNAFNSLVGLIEEDKDRSIIFVERITDFYRNMLEYGKENLIVLKKEKTILEQYVDILKTRFNGQLDIRIHISQDLEKLQIPPLTLQLLVENAVKHNVVSTKNPLRIDITQVGEKLIVRNDKKKLMSASPGTKTGIENINKRFELVNLPLPIIDNNPEYFEVTLQLKIKE